MGLCNPSLLTQARHQFFDWKLETRRERVPSAPLAFYRNGKKPKGVILDSTT